MTRCTDAPPLDWHAFLGADGNGWGLLADRALYHRHVRTGVQLYGTIIPRSCRAVPSAGTFGARFGSGDVVTLTLDCDAGQLCLML